MSTSPAIATDAFYDAVGRANDFYDADAWSQFTEIVKETPALLPTAIDLFVNVDYLRKTMKLWLESGACSFGDEKYGATAKCALMIALLTERDQSTNTLADMLETKNPPYPLNKERVIRLARDGLSAMERGLREQTKKGVTGYLHINLPTKIIAGDGRVLKPLPTTLNLAVTRLGFR